MNVNRDYIGSQFVWFFGVVEDRNDPIKLGRVRVRVYEYYDKDKQAVPVNALPWAQVIQSPTSAATGDIGQTPTGMVEGTWVVGFFLDGHRAQQPIVLGTFSGIPQELGSDKPYQREGFTDPNGVYPNRKDEPDVNRLARNDKDFQHPNPGAKNDARTKEVPLANQTTKWNEPVAAYDSDPDKGVKYPKNHVYETESGHIKEFDDTEGKERIHEYHKAGTFYEVDKAGKKVTRIVANNYVVIAGTDYVNVKGDCHLTVDSNCTTYIKGNWDIQVDGNKTENIKGKLTQTVDDSVTETYKNNQTTNITGTLDLDASTEIDADAGVINLN